MYKTVFLLQSYQQYMLKTFGALPMQLLEKKKLNSNHLFGQWLFIPYPHSMNRYAFIKVTPLEFYALVFALQFVFFLIEKKQQNAYFLIFFK